jgi:hypothetical protein
MHRDMNRSYGLILSHIYLLVACAAPLWILAIACYIQQDYCVKERNIIMIHSGWISVGLGDAMVSAFVLRCRFCLSNDG